MVQISLFSLPQCHSYHKIHFFERFKRMSFPFLPHGSFFASKKNHLLIPTMLFLLNWFRLPLGNHKSRACRKNPTFHESCRFHFNTNGDWFRSWNSYNLISLTKRRFQYKWTTNYNLMIEFRREKINTSFRPLFLNITLASDTEMKNIGAKE